MIFIISALTSAEIREIVNELDCCDPLHHLEPELMNSALVLTKNVTQNTASNIAQQAKASL